MKQLILFLLIINSFLCAVPPSTLYHNTNNYHSYLWGTYNQLEGKPEIAQYYYEEILKTSDSPYAYPGYLTHLFEKKEYQKIINLMPAIDEQLSDNLNSQLIFVKTLELGNTHEAA